MKNIKTIKAEIFPKDKINFGFSTKVGLGRKSPFFFNLSLSTNDNPDEVKLNRKEFFKEVGIDQGRVVYHSQIHSDIVHFADLPGHVGSGDALVTNKKNLALVVTSADCTCIFIYDRVKEIIAAVHSGWRGTQKGILRKTLNILTERFNSNPDDLLVYVAPSVSQECYEVGKEVAEQFNHKYVLNKEGSLYLDVAGCNNDMLTESGIPEINIEHSPLCSFKNRELHSYRRDKEISGRAFGVIMMKDD